MRMELEVIEEGEEREETSRTTRSMQIETGDMTPMISTPIDSRMLPPSMIREVGLVGNSVEWVVGSLDSIETGWVFSQITTICSSDPLGHEQEPKLLLKLCTLRN